ncbi:TFIIS central domain-containing protein [Skeletonema marinoi]|uniref:TFIIS central domain-containing protein n=1 Tax=Skeletonema marinoi TaxID=267567 RepID=A0AAD8YN66_9STRA|nr:TFIIS central domain-containing protein [Skeletonema marinoi]
MASQPNNHEMKSLETTSSNNNLNGIAFDSVQAPRLITNGTANVVDNNTPQQFAMQSMQTSEQPLPTTTEVSNNNTGINKPEATEEIDMELWANSLVGRWWEIFWEPNEENDGDDIIVSGDVGGNISGGGYQVNDNTTQDVAMSIRGGGIEDDDTSNNNGVLKMEDTTAQSSANNTPVTAAAGQTSTAQTSTAAPVEQQQQQQRQKQASIPIQQRQRPRSSIKHNKSSTQQKRRTSQQSLTQPYQHRPRFLDYDATKKQTQQQQQQPPAQPVIMTRPQPALPQSTPIMRPQTVVFNAVYHQPKLGLSLRQQQQQQQEWGKGTTTTAQVGITEISPNAPNANLIQVGDVIVGINGKRFPSGSVIGGSSDDQQRKAHFNLVVTALRDTPRPMTVNFERRLISSSSFNNNTDPSNYMPVAVASQKVAALQSVGGSVQSIQMTVQPQQQLGVVRGMGQTNIAMPTPNPLLIQHAHTTANAAANSSDNKYNPKAPPAKLTERELQYPLEPAATTDFPPGWNKRVIPRENQSAGKKSNDTYYYSPIQGYKFRSRPEVRQFLEMLARRMGDEVGAFEEFRREKSKKRSDRKPPSSSLLQSSTTAMEVDGNMGERKRRSNSFEDDTQSESDVTSTADDDDDTGADAIDWYDGKILSYADGNFVVYFLGDTEDVTYTMPLTPKIVRPSVRAWTKRTLALLSCDVDLTNEGTIPREIVDSLPPSTDIPKDENKLACVGESGDENNPYMRLIQYGKLLETQIQLAKQLSPHADDDQSGGTVDGEDEGPGPFANKSYVKHLRNCLGESKKVCDWLSREVDALNVFKRVNGGTQDPLASAHVSKDSMQSFLVHGATFLQRILALVPNKVDAVSNEHHSTNGRKRRRANTNEPSEQQQNSDNILPMVSSDSLDEAMTSILNGSGEDKQQMLMTSTLNQIVSVLYLDLWQPNQDWIKEAEDMIYGKSTKFYSIEDIESHVQASQKLTLFDISSWRIDLEAKLNRARFFEMEAWSAIKACTALDESGNTAASSDSCLLALNRLQNELCSTTLAAGEQSIMRNMNPLGKQSVSANGTHSLTRDDIENAIKTRQWILDLVQAKTSRERASFVQSVIERYVMLPQLPSPPFSGFGESASDPTTLLKENTKDSISVLSANCYSHTHIVGNMAARLSSSMQSTSQDTSLRTKEGIASALAELRQLPVLSVVEEKLHARHQLIDWNVKALQMKGSTTATGKQHFQTLEKLHNELSSILSMANCQDVRPNEYIEREVKWFVAEDVKLICPESGTWVRNQYKRGCDWRQNYLSIKSVLQPYGYNFGEILSSASAASVSGVDVSRIKNLLVDHDTLASCFVEECNHLREIEKIVNGWAAAVNQVLVNDSHHLEARYNELVKVEASRPKGIIANPPRHVVDLWVRVLKWGLNLKTGVESITEKLLEWKAVPFQQHEVETQDAEFHESVRLTKLLLTSIIVEGQDFMLSKDVTLTPLLSQLRSKTITSFSNGNCARLIRKEVVESSIHGELLLSRVIGAEADLQSGFPLRFVRDIFWRIMACSLIQHSNNGGRVDLNDVKTLSTLCVRDSKVSSSVNKLIGDAEQLQRNATNVVATCLKLLQMNCFLHQNELRNCLVDLQIIQSDFKSQEFESAAGLLRSTGVETMIAAKLTSVTWLVDTFSHPIIFDSVNGSEQSRSIDPISVDDLRLLYERNPVSVTSRGGNDLDKEVLRVYNLVKDLHHRAQEWQKTARSLINLDKGSTVSEIIKVETIEALTQSLILSKVTCSELSILKNAVSVALEVKDGLANDLFRDEYNGIDVNKGRLPERSSLLAASGDFLLYRFTGGEMYSAIEKALNSLKEISSQLLVTTEDKATVDWMVKVFDWVTLLRDAVTDQTAVEGPNNMRLVLKVDHALSILEHGHAVFYSIPDEVQQQLFLNKITTKILPRKLSVEMMKQSTFTLGLSLLRWSVMLFECLKVDLDSQDSWKEAVLHVIETYQMFEANGLVSTFGRVTEYNDQVKELVSVAANLVIQDDDLIRSLFRLSNKISNSDVFRKQLEFERVAFEERRFALEKNRFEAPLNIVNARNDHLDSLLARLSSANEDVAVQDDEDTLFLANDASVRDKSRLFLEKSLFKGVETLGMELCQQTRDFVSNLAWELELAIFMKYCSNETLSSEYREKVRSLRFNLQDPKNPMLCTRVVSGQLEIPDLIVMSTDALASKQLKQIRQQVVQDAIKNVVISPGSNEASSGITSELAKKIRIESIKKSNATTKKAGNTPHNSPATNSAISPGSASFSPMQADPPMLSTFNNSTVSELLAAIPPPPMLGNERPAQSLKPPTLDNDAPPSMMMYPPPPHESSSFEISHSHHGHHIPSQDGSEEFSFTISRLKVSFTSKIFIDQSCQLQLDGFLPTSLVEKGRLPVDEFNKFVNEKSRSGKWKVVIMKLSSMSGGENTSSYKRFYKEYESLRRICMFQVSDTTKVFLITPKFLRICKCVNSLKDLSRTSTYVVVTTKEPLSYCQSN